MKAPNYSALILLCAFGLPLRGEAQGKDFTAKGGCVLRAWAYIDRVYPPREASRFDLGPVRIKLECPAPNFLVSSAADNTYQTIAVSLPNLKTATHLDALTLIVRQRTDLRTIPLALRVPVTQPARGTQ